ncbi:MAG: Glu-tRNA(Gln) amidotransferase subunit GatE [Thermoanaerobaculia bacterium]|nr:Glu-tRNA(Gln) amidotransferase subunit GatE [Thermoanaerobaculia bacterium]
MNPTLDYAEVGFVCGLEVHQQLLTRTKLFCRCPAGLYTESHDGTVLRHMRPTLSELGEYDGTALMEFKTRKNIVYLLHEKNVCTYEMDDTPPFLVNQEAIDIAIEQCLMLGCDIVDEVHIARKQYLDGSIPTGFQRTAIVGVNGTIPFRGRTLSVTQVSVEEDSCREVSDKGHCIVWRADRLGMPLIETVTGPDLRTPDEVEEAILLVGRVCRSTGHVRTGIGASRQDVNVSVRGGRRVEIKGVSKAGWAPRLVHGEAWRQVNLLRLRDELHRRGFTSRESIRVESQDVTGFFAASGIPELRQEGWERWVESQRMRRGYEIGKGPFRVRALRLAGLAGTLAWPTQPEHVFAHELAGRVRVIAGLDQSPILLHPEGWPDSRGARAELKRLRGRLRCDADDAVVVVWGPEEDTLTAAEEIRLRYADATDGVPNETRQPFPDGATDFERILPGPDRMYPDTDSPPTRVTRDRVARLAEDLAERPWDRERRYTEAGVPRQVTHFLIRRGGAALVDRLVAATGAPLAKVAELVGARFKGLRRQGVAIDAVPEARWHELLAAFAARPVVAQAWRPLVIAIAEAPERPVPAPLADRCSGAAPPGWRDALRPALARAAVRAYRPEPGLIRRLALAELMGELLGSVPAGEVAAALAETGPLPGEEVRG